jgi:hypothetical protein
VPAQALRHCQRRSLIRSASARSRSRRRARLDRGQSHALALSSSEELGWPRRPNMTFPLNSGWPYLTSLDVNADPLAFYK